MMLKPHVRQEELERVNTLSVIEVVAYANALSRRLRSDECTEEEMKNGLALLERLTDRVRFLNISLEPAYYRGESGH